MGTINSKRELWPKNPEKTSKTMLKTKSVDAEITPFFSRVKFQHVLKMAVKINFLCKNYPKIPPKRSVDVRITFFFAQW